MNNDIQKSLQGCGDLSTTPEEQTQLAQSQICVQKYHADVNVNREIHTMDLVSQAAFILDLLWPVDGSFTVSFLPLPDTLPQWYTVQQLQVGKRPNEPLQLDPLEDKVRKMGIIDAVKTIITERLIPLVGLDIKFVDTDGDVRIGFDVNGGSWSYVGQQCKSEKNMSKPTINFGWLDVGTIMHEFCHTLGMIHEHQNPFGKSIQWNTCKVYQWAIATQNWDTQTTFNNIIKKYDTNSINGSCFDSRSIMLYFYPADFTKNNQGTFANHVLSEEDKKWLTNLYPKDRKNRVFPADQKCRQLNTVSIAGTQQQSHRNIFIIIGVIVLVVIIGLLLYFYKKNKSSKRYK